jgi:hypothetical protein
MVPTGCERSSSGCMFLMGTSNRKHWLRARIIIDDGG